MWLKAFVSALPMAVWFYGKQSFTETERITTEYNLHLRLLALKEYGMQAKFMTLFKICFNNFLLYKESFDVVDSFLLFMRYRWDFMVTRRHFLI